MSNKRLAHAGLQTTQREELRDWYRDVLDAHIVYENEVLSFLTFDEEHHRLAIMGIPGLADRIPTTVGLVSCASN